ncbi:hypothetical protein GCM10017083_15010 [Thalassobaculum fulvum]|uniref:Uncharacterized protein n=2 Tax=Thalassobaculum fulvum TaxID=1633335 RepID=A0A919CNM5_9PROT|nr:hypothetical protein GCM10017083_15010 [Thalassobaculum fulvum]
MDGQLVAIGKYRTVKWNEILSNKSHYRALLLEPVPWVAGNFHILLDSARQRPVSIEFMFPDIEAPYISDLAESLGFDEMTYKAAIDGCVAQIEKMWSAQKEEGAIKEGSRVSIKISERRPLQSLVLSDNITVLVLTGAMGREGADHDFAYVYFGDRQSYPSSWFLRQMERLESAPIKFENEV